MNIFFFILSKRSRKYKKDVNIIILMNTGETEQILEKLDSIKEELDYIKQHIIDVDAVLTEDDFDSLFEADKDLKAGKTKRL